MDKEKQKSFKACRKWTLILGGLGFLISYYAFFVSNAKLNDSSYMALCDISESMSCSVVLTSEYSKGFGIIGKIFGADSPFNQSNSFYGMIFYGLICVTCLYPAVFLAKAQLLLSVMSTVVTVYLSYVLFCVLEVICVVCVATYIINLIFLVITIKNYKVVAFLKEQSTTTDYSSYLDGKSKKRV